MISEMMKTQEVFMTPAELREPWAHQAQRDAAVGVIECRESRRRGALDETTTVWRNRSLVFALSISRWLRP